MTPDLAPLLQRPRAMMLAIILVLLMIAAMVVRGRMWARLAMAALIGRYLFVYLG